MTLKRTFSSSAFSCCDKSKFMLCSCFVGWYFPFQPHVLLPSPSLTVCQCIKTTTVHKKLRKKTAFCYIPSSDNNWSAAESNCPSHRACNWRSSEHIPLKCKILYPSFPFKTCFCQGGLFISLCHIMWSDVNPQKLQNTRSFWGKWKVVCVVWDKHNERSVSAAKHVKR